MTTRKLISSLTLLTIVLGCSACAPGPQGEPPETPAETETQAQPAPPAAEEVTYEPAYPENVSTEELTDDDTAQQEDRHFHGESGAHSHGADEEQGSGDDHQH